MNRRLESELVSGGVSQVPDRNPILIALTEASELTFGGKSVVIDRWPFRVGRDQRARNGNVGGNGDVERRRADVHPTEGLFLYDPHRRKFVSRTHFQLEKEGDRYFLVDRESACGTWVGGRPIGGKRRGGRTTLNPGEEIAIGGKKSPFRLRFELS